MLLDTKVKTEEKCTVDFSAGLHMYLSYIIYNMNNIKNCFLRFVRE